MKELTISDDRQVAKQLAQRYRCEFVELSGTDLDLDLFRSIQAELMFPNFPSKRQYALL